MASPKTTTVVALFVRIPVPGRVKTRLAHDIGDIEACRLYQAMVKDVLVGVRASGFPVYIFHDEPGDADLPEQWTATCHSVVCQQGDDLGERLAHAFERCFADDAEKVILAGSDIPGIDDGVVLASSAMLSIHAAAIVPAVDGGYCLVALRRENYHSGLFRGVPWGSDKVLQATLERCQHFGLSVGLLKAMRDIDTMDDLGAYCCNPSEVALTTNDWLISAGYLRK